MFSHTCHLKELCLYYTFLPDFRTAREVSQEQVVNCKDIALNFGPTKFSNLGYFSFSLSSCTCPLAESRQLCDTKVLSNCRPTSALGSEKSSFLGKTSWAVCHSSPLFVKPKGEKYNRPKQILIFYIGGRIQLGKGQSMKAPKEKKYFFWAGGTLGLK